jgi:hypothetical protein
LLIDERSPPWTRWTNCMMRRSIASGSPPTAANAAFIRPM